MLDVFSKKFHQQTNFNFRPGATPVNSGYWPKESKMVSHKNYPRFPKKELSHNFLKIEVSGDTFTSVNQQREFDWRNKLSLDELSTILHYSTGLISSNIDKKNEPLSIFYPYGEMRYPLELYLAIQLVDEIIPGIYHLNIKDETLETLTVDPDYMESIFGGLLYPQASRQAAVAIFTTAIWDRNFIQYKGRGYRMALLEAGQLNHNFAIISSALGINCCSNLGFDNKIINEVLNIENEEEDSLYMTLLGR